MSKKPFKYFLDSIITTIVGIVTMLLTLFFVWQRVFDFVWEGIAGLSIGCLLLMAPKAVETLIGKAIRYIGGVNSFSLNGRREEPRDI